MRSSFLVLLEVPFTSSRASIGRTPIRFGCRRQNTWHRRQRSTGSDGSRGWRLAASRRSQEDIAHIQGGVRDAYGVDALVVGLPLRTDGTEGSRSRCEEVEAFGLKLAEGAEWPPGHMLG